MRVALLPLGLAAVLLGACAARNAERDSAQRVTLENQETRTTAALIAAGDADSLEAAALLGGSRGDDPNERLALIRRAAAAAPGRADIAWWQLQLCTQVASCDSDAPAARLRALDAGNGAAWTPALTRAARRKDTTAFQQTLVAIADSERFGVYWTASVAHTAGAVLAVHTLQAKNALALALGAAAAQSVPYKAMLDGCAGPALRHAEVLAVCRRLAALLRRSDTYLSEIVGLTIAANVWPEGSSEYQAAAAERRVVQYRTEKNDHLMTRKPLDDVFAARYLELYATHDSEQAVVTADLVNAGISPDPPLSYRMPMRWRARF